MHFFHNVLNNYRIINSIKALNVQTQSSGKMHRFSEREWDRKIKREREVRRRKSKCRQFDEPLRIFIQTKYKDIYQEYNDLYVRMLEDCSVKKDLTKSKTFKEWLKANNGDVQTPSASGSQGSDSQDDEPEADDETAAEVEQANVEVEQAAIEVEQASSVLGEALRDILEQEVVDPVSADFNLNVEIVAEILDELQEDRSLRNVLEGGNEDEGIELSYFDDIEMDIQPFNYDLEG